MDGNRLLGTISTKKLPYRTMLECGMSVKACNLRALGARASLEARVSCPWSVLASARSIPSRETLGDSHEGKERQSASRNVKLRNVSGG